MPKTKEAKGEKEKGAHEGFVLVKDGMWGKTGRDNRVYVLQFHPGDAWKDDSDVRVTEDYLGQHSKVWDVMPLREALSLIDLVEDTFIRWG